jgi:hypothetical protein
MVMSVFRRCGAFIRRVMHKLQQLIVSFKNRITGHFKFLHEHRHARKYFWISLVIPAIVIFTLVVILPLKINLPVVSTQNSNQNFFIPAEMEIDQIEVLKKFSNKMVDLKSEELFLNSQVAMAKRDSINLIVNLMDSVVSLNIQGVNIRECKIYHYKLSHAFKHIKANPLFFDWMAEPFALRDEWATTAKVPIKIRKAPKDTIEAKKYKTEPAALDKPDIYFTMQFDRNLFLRVKQVESITFWGWLRRCLYQKIVFLNISKDTILALFYRTTPQYPYWIEITISKNDALAIYRALPNKAALALRLPPA